MDTNTDTIQVGDLFAVAALPFLVGFLFWVFMAGVAARRWHRRDGGWCSSSARSFS